MLANGGIVTSPTLAMIGEGNGPEAVIPLNRMNEFGMGGGMNVTVQAGLISTPDQMGQLIIEAIQRAQRRSGTVFQAA
jgi:SLT domain-containing protein